MERTIKRVLAVGCDLNKNRAVLVDFEIHISVYQRLSAVGLLYQHLSAFISGRIASLAFISVHQRSDCSLSANISVHWNPGIQEVAESTHRSQTQASLGGLR